MSKKNITSLSIVDIKINIIKKMYFYIPVILITIIYCISAYNKYSFYRDINEIRSDMSLGHYFSYLWKGEMIFSHDVSDKTVKIPAFITFFFLYNGFLICRYLNIKRSFSMGNFYLKSSSNFMWHISKLIWCTISTLLLFGIFFLCTFVFALFSGSISLDTSDDIIQCLLGSDYPALQANFGQLVLMPFLVLISTAFIQVFLSLLLSPIIAYTMLIIYYVSSLFLCKSSFIYNYVILLRSDVYDSNGVSYNDGIILNAVLVLLIFITYVLISKKKKEKFIK